MRLRGIDGCRAIAATLIVVFHAWDLGGRHDGGAVWLLSRAWVGVPFFFALSGFLLYRPYARATMAGASMPSLRRYAAARVARIMPGYWFAALAALALIGPTIIGATIWSTIRDLGFAQIYDPGGPLPLVTPAWTLCLEVLFYATLPLIAWTVRRASGGDPARMVAALLVLAAVGLADGLPVGLRFMESLDQFALGMIAAVAVEARWRVPRPGLAGLLVVAAALPFVDGQHPLQTPLLSAGFALIVLHVATTDRTPLAWRPLAAAGVISYGIFLWHYQAMLVVREWTTSPAMLFAVGAPAAVAFATLSWFAVERPAIRLAHRRSGGGSVGRPVLADQVRADLSV